MEEIAEMIITKTFKTHFLPAPAPALAFPFLTAPCAIDLSVSASFYRYSDPLSTPRLQRQKDLARILGLVGLGAVNSVGWAWDGDRGSFGGIVVSILGVVGEGGLGIRGCWWELLL